MWDSPAIGVPGLVSCLAWALGMKRVWFSARAVCFLHGWTITPAPSYSLFDAGTSSTKLACGTGLDKQQLLTAAASPAWIRHLYWETELHKVFLGALWKGVLFEGGRACFLGDHQIFCGNHTFGYLKNFCFAVVHWSIYPVTPQYSWLKTFLATDGTNFATNWVLEERRRKCVSWEICLLPSPSGLQAFEDTKMKLSRVAREEDWASKHSLLVQWGC